MPISKAQQLGNHSKINVERRKYLIKECDRLFSKLVVENKPCFFKPYLWASDPFYIVPRGRWSWRWSKENVVPASREIHNRWHDGDSALEWLEDVRPEKYQFYIAHRWEMNKEPSLEELEELYNELKEEYYAKRYY